MWIVSAKRCEVLLSLHKSPLHPPRFVQHQTVFRLPQFPTPDCPDSTLQTSLLWPAALLSQKKNLSDSHIRLKLLTCEQFVVSFTELSRFPYKKNLSISFFIQNRNSLIAPLQNNFSWDAIIIERCDYWCLLSCSVFWRQGTKRCNCLCKDKLPLFPRYQHSNFQFLKILWHTKIGHFSCIALDCQPALILASFEQRNKSK